MEINVCGKCFENKGIKKFIETARTDGECHFCKSNQFVLSTKKIFEYIKKCIEHKYQKYIDGSFRIKDIFTREGLVCNNMVKTEILSLSSDAYSEKSEIDFTSNPLEILPLIISWDRFKKFVIADTRFFCLQREVNYNYLGGSYLPGGILKKIIIAVQNNSDYIVSTMQQGQGIFRARSFFRSNQYNAKNLGPPSAGSLLPTRMSPMGIPSFYAAKEKNVAIQEIKKNATEFIIGEWEFNKDINIIDFTKQSTCEIDFFDIELQKKRDELLFFDKFSNDISKSIDKDERSHIDYIPTQILSEFIKISFKDINGIAYRSQKLKHGTNLCMFTDRIKFCDDFSNDKNKTECRLKKHEILKS